MNGWVIDLGLMESRASYELQLRFHEKVLSGAFPDTLLLVEHPPVLTLGAGFHAENLLHNIAEYEAMGIAVVTTDRGGDVTYHGPNQLVSYPIFDLSRHGKDLHKWLRELEETQLTVLHEFSLEGRRFPPNTGAWVGDKKVAAIGVKVRKWVNLHGIALNVENDLSPFGKFIPCGIRDYGVTSVSELTGRTGIMNEAKQKTIRAFERVFGLNFESKIVSEVFPEKTENPLARPNPN